MAILDTTFLIDLERGLPAARHVLSALKVQGAALRVPAQAAIEYLTGLEQPSHGIQKLTEAFEILHLSEAGIVAIASLARQAMDKGAALSWSDAHVAAAAIAFGEPVVTEDAAPFQALGIPVVRHRSRVQR